jgi:Icc-related predicted phosphoesterase
MDDDQRIHLLRARRPLRPRDTDRYHRDAARFLRRATHDAPARATVVVTHHAPSPTSVDPRYADALTSAAFVARRDALLRQLAPAAWIHGHVHVSVDNRIGPTRIVANPRGHPGENPAFQPGRTIEV